MDWKDIVGYEGLYKVSNTGLVKSLDRITNTGNSIKGSFKSLHSDKDGYKIVVLFKNGIRKNKKVHRLVAESFKPNPLNKPCVNHIDGDKHNNCPSNLEWCTVAENNLHSINKGLRKIRGEYRYNTKLNKECVLEICYLLDNTNLTQFEIGNKFKVSNLVISRINTGRTWNWLTNRKCKGGNSG